MLDAMNLLSDFMSRPQKKIRKNPRKNEIDLTRDKKK
jgi:hypothetical protein